MTNFELGQEFYLVDSYYAYITIPCSECDGSKVIYSKKTGNTFDCPVCKISIFSVGRPSGCAIVPKSDYYIYKAFGPHKILGTKELTGQPKEYLYYQDSHDSADDNYCTADRMFTTKELADTRCKELNSAEIYRLGNSL